MKHILKLSLFLISMAVTYLSQAQVKSDYDKKTDFNQFKTFSFEGWQKNSDSLINDFDKKRILNALKSELEARGMTYVEKGEADVSVALYLVLDKKTSTTAYTDYMGGMGYGPGWGWGYGMGGSTTTFEENDYLEGTLVVDIYHSEDKKLLWQGILTSIVKENPKKREKSIPKNIKKLMRKYPVNIKK